MKETVLGKFTAKSDSGRTHTIVIYQEWIDASTMDDPGAKIPGMKRLATSSGEAVNRIDEKTFQIVATGETVRVP